MPQLSILKSHYCFAMQIDPKQLFIALLIDEALLVHQSSFFMLPMLANCHAAMSPPLDRNPMGFSKSLNPTPAGVMLFVKPANFLDQVRHSPGTLEKSARLLRVILSFFFWFPFSYLGLDNPQSTHILKTSFRALSNHGSSAFSIKISVDR